MEFCKEVFLRNALKKMHDQIAFTNKSTLAESIGYFIHTDNYKEISTKVLNSTKENQEELIKELLGLTP